MSKAFDCSLPHFLSYDNLIDMRYAIFSDIHNDAIALSTVLTHTNDQKVDAYFCLGDVGIDECVDMVRAVNAPTIFGNWEASNWRYLSPENQKWVLNLPSNLKMKQFWLTHAALTWPPKLATLADLNEDPYFIPRSKLFPYLHVESDILWETIATLSEANIPLMFHGHTHRQVAWRFTGDNQLQRLVQENVQLYDGETLIVGVGSVGRPVDGPDPAYAIYDEASGVIEMIRVNKAE